MIAFLLAAQLTTAPAVDCSLLTPQQARGLPCAAPVVPTAEAGDRGERAGDHTQDQEERHVRVMPDRRPSVH